MVTRIPEAVQSIACGPSNSIAVSVVCQSILRNDSFVLFTYFVRRKTGVAYVWGQFAGPQFGLEQVLPRRLDQPFRRRIFVADAKCGLTHYMFLEDTKKVWKFLLAFGDEPDENFLLRRRSC